MGGLLALLVVMASLAVILGLLTLLAIHARRRGIGDQVMGPFDEIWHPAAHAARIEIHQQEARSAPVPSPAGPLLPPEV